MRWDDMVDENRYKTVQIEELRAEVDRLRGIIEGLECYEKAEHGGEGYECRDIKFADGARIDSRYWCAVCKAKEAARADKP